MELIGRERELEDLVERLAARRVVTVIGPGGIGKTALASAAAARLAGDFELGVRTVDLTRVDTGDAVASAIASQLGYASFDELVDAPTDRSVLLLVDNCEHVTDAAAAAIAAIVDSCEAPVVLATSRSPLDIPGESLVLLGPLGVPVRGAGDADDADDADDAGAPSVRLFLERARDAGADIGEDRLEDVGELCRRLDGVPLALELAAARTRSLSPGEILRRLDGHIDVLSRPRFRGPPRHRSLSETIEWSYRLLDDDTAHFLDRLGVFAGPFTGAMAQAVAAPGGDGGDGGPPAADAALGALVDASLVSAERRGDVTWYRLLETVRRFAVERLVEAGELDATVDRFVGHVVTRAVEIMVAGGGRWDSRTMSDLLGHYDNIAAALRWCLAHDDDGRRSLLLCSVLWGVIHQAHTDEVAALARHTLAKWPDPRSRFAADAAATLATATYLSGDPTGAIELAERTLAAAPASSFAPVTLHRVIGQASRALGDTDRSIAAFGRMAAEARARDSAGMAMEADVDRALVLADTGKVAEARELCERARVEAVALGSDINAVWAQTASAYAMLRVDPAAAWPAIEDALSASRRIGYPAGVSANLRSVALAHLALGRPVAAAGVLLELLDELVGRGALSDLHVVLDTAAVVLHAAGREAWLDVAATARTLPIVSMMASVGHELFTLPPATDGAVLSRRDAIRFTRAELRSLCEGATGDVETERGSVAAPAHAASAAPPAAGSVLALRGDVCEIEFAGRRVVVKTSKGLADLARLLASPDREIHCLELMGAGLEQPSTGEVIDATARREYEQRVRELQDDIDTADADHDYERADRARVELDALVDHLASALGLGGRSRRGASSAERARSAVTQRLRATIRRIADVHPELGRHLSVSITTGTYCSYRPDRAVHWRT